MTGSEPRAEIDAHDLIVRTACEAQDDQRYGSLTNPFILGLLTAAEIVEGRYDGRKWKR